MGKLYAHTVIEDGDKRYEPGDAVPADTSGIDALKKSKAVQAKAYEPPEPEAPAEQTIDGVRYVRAKDGAKATGKAKA